LAPNLDLFAEIATIAMYFGERHGDRIAAETGVGEGRWELDLTGLQASVGIDPGAPGAGLTHRELQARRLEIRDKLEAAPPRRRSRRRGRGRHPEGSD
jgi:hypothetical protein